MYKCIKAQRLTSVFEAGLRNNCLMFFREHNWCHLVPLNVSEGECKVSPADMLMNVVSNCASVRNLVMFVVCCACSNH